MNGSPKILSRLSRWLSYLFVIFGLIYAMIDGSYNWRGRFDVQLVGLVSCVLFCFFYFVIRFLKKALLPRTGLEYLFLIAGIFLVVSLAASPVPRQGFWRVAWIFGYILLFYILIDLFDIGCLNHTQVLDALLFVSGLVIFLAVLEAYSWYLSWFQNGVRFEIPPSQFRFGSIFGYSNVLMCLANLLAPLAILRLLSIPSRSGKFGVGLWLAGYTIALPFSSSRSGFLSTFVWVTVFLLFWLIRKRAWQKIPRLNRQGKFLGLIGLGAAGILLVLGGVLFWKTFAAQVNHGISLFGSRDNIWNHALLLWNSSPILGVGPGRFIFEYPGVYSDVPPYFWPYNAHSLPVESLAEFGLVGTLLLCAGVVWVSHLLVSRYRMAPHSQKSVALTILVGLIALLVHMIFDDFTSWISIMFPLILILAWFWTISNHRIPRCSGLNMTPCLSLFILLITFSIWDLWGYYPTWTALQLASRNDWRAAATNITRSILRDPGSAFYKTQAAFAWSKVWKIEADPSALVKAREYFQQSILQEPHLSMLWANLSVLDWQAGDKESAVKHMYIAFRSSPHMPEYALNLGYFLEESGRWAEAVKMYRYSINIAPDLGSHPFWQSSEVRFQAWEGEHNRGEPPVIFHHPFSDKAAQELETGDYLAARSSLNRSALMGEPYLASEVLAVRFGILKNLPDEWTKSAVQIQEYLDAAYLRTQSNFAFGYSLWGYNRPGLLIDIVPGFMHLEPDYGQYAILQDLYQFENRQGDCQSARRTWDVLEGSLSGWNSDQQASQPPCP